MTQSNYNRRQWLIHAAGWTASAALASVFSGGGAARAATGGARSRVIIDTDPGVDDAMAILLALRSPELQVEAITPVAGNVPLELTLPNALRLLEIAGRGDIPVAAGAREPLKRQLVTAAYVHGNNGLAGVEFPAPKLKPVAESAASLIRRMVRQSPGEISIIALGPLTNVAQAFSDDPRLPAQVRDITIMGGSLSGGNITPAAEFNSYVDPEAAQIVYASGARITMVGLDVTRKAHMTEEHIGALEAAKNPSGRAAGRIMRATLEQVQRTGGNNGILLVHDAMAVATRIDPSLVTLEEMHIEVETQGERTAGETLGYRKAPMHRSAPLHGAQPPAEDTVFHPNAKVAVNVDAPRFLQFLIGRLTG
jgi:inosine-uridine nucleoside N-ribohydrolase